MATTLIDEFVRVSSMLSGLTVSVPIMMITWEQVERIAQCAVSDPTLAALAQELRAKLKAITAGGPCPDGSGL